PTGRGSGAAGDASPRRNRSCCIRSFFRFLRALLLGRLFGQPYRLAQELAKRLGGIAGPDLARRNIGQDAAAGRDAGAFADGDVVAHARPAAEDAVVAAGDRTRDAGVRRHQVIAADDAVVADHDQIIDLGVLADDSDVIGAPVDAGGGP